MKRKEIYYNGLCIKAMHNTIVCACSWNQDENYHHPCVFFFSFSLIFLLVVLFSFCSYYDRNSKPLKLFSWSYKDENIDAYVNFSPLNEYKFDGWIVSNVSNDHWKSSLTDCLLHLQQRNIPTYMYNICICSYSISISILLMLLPAQYIWLSLLLPSCIILFNSRIILYMVICPFLLCGILSVFASKNVLNFSSFFSESLIHWNIFLIFAV